MTVHAEEEMDEDDLTISDVKRCILTGEIVDKQKHAETKEWKYTRDALLPKFFSGGMRMKDTKGFLKKVVS